VPNRSTDTLDLGSTCVIIIFDSNNYKNISRERKTTVCWLR